MAVRKRFGRLMALLMVSGILMGGGTAVGAVTAQQTFVPVAEECQFLALVNEYRAVNGIAPLSLSITLSNAARHHSEQVAATEYFSHTLPDGTSWEANIRNFGYTYNTWIGENLAAGNLNPAYTLLQWQRSDPHNANMLAPEFTAIGIGLAVNPGSAWGYYWTTTFGGFVDETATC